MIVYVFYKPFIFKNNLNIINGGEFFYTNKLSFLAHMLLPDIKFHIFLLIVINL